MQAAPVGGPQPWRLGGCSALPLAPTPVPIPGRRHRQDPYNPMMQCEATPRSYDLSPPPSNPIPVSAYTAAALGNNATLILRLGSSLGLCVWIEKFLLPFPTCKVGPL